MTKKRLGELLAFAEKERKEAIDACIALRNEVNRLSCELNIRTEFMNHLFRLMEDEVIPSFKEIEISYNYAIERHRCQRCIRDNARHPDCTEIGCTAYVR